jgi:hypothetical protein
MKEFNTPNQRATPKFFMDFKCSGLNYLDYAPGGPLLSLRSTVHASVVKSAGNAPHPTLTALYMDAMPDTKRRDIKLQ